MSTADQIALLQAGIYLVQSVLLLFSLWAVIWSNRQIAKAQRASTLQMMVSEMNQLRTYRAEHPDLERELFDKRKNWTDVQVQSHMVAVQLANILEWAYIARRNNLLEKEIWESWVKTWSHVILASEPLKKKFDGEVWTFGRDPEMVKCLKQLTIHGEIPDPLEHKSAVWEFFAGKPPY